MVQVLSFSPPPVDRREILRYAGCRQPGPAEMDLLESCLAELGDRLRCQVCWDTFPVSSGGGRSGPGFCLDRLRASPGGCPAAGSVCFSPPAVGLELDRLIARYGAVSPARGLFFQAIGAERIEALCDAFCARQAEELARQGLGVTQRFSPGYGVFGRCLSKGTSSG